MGSKRILIEEIEAYAREFEEPVFEYEMFVDSMREERKINDVINRMAEGAGATELLGEMDFNAEKFHDDVVKLFDAIVPESRASQVFIQA